MLFLFDQMLNWVKLAEYTSVYHKIEFQLPFVSIFRISRLSKIDHFQQLSTYPIRIHHSIKKNHFESIIVNDFWQHLKEKPHKIFFLFS